MTNEPKTLEELHEYRAHLRWWAYLSECSGQMEDVPKIHRLILDTTEKINTLLQAMPTQNKPENEGYSTNQKNP